MDVEQKRKAKLSQGANLTFETLWELGMNREKLRLYQAENNNSHFRQKAINK